MNETGLKIKILGEPVLRKKAKPVKKVDDECRQLLSRMSRLMYAAKGVGLAAPQVGLSRSLIVVDIGSGLYKLVNPKIVKKEGSQKLEEGCLSVPGVYIKVRRAKKVRVNALDEDGRQLTIDAGDLLACVLQHEIDHLNGKLIVDYASLLQKLALRKKLKSHKNKVADERLPEPEAKFPKL